jgi:TonB family protein
MSSIKTGGRVLVLSFLAGLVLYICGCAPSGTSTRTEGGPASELDFLGALKEVPPPDGNWRGHQLAGCAGDQDVPGRVEKLLATCVEFFREGSGSDGMIEMEMALEKGTRHSLIDLTLGQLYLLAGQGEPGLLPVEGPAADVGDWPRNKARLLERARTLLQRASWERPDDAVVDYLLADVCRASGDQALAAEYVAQAGQKCTAGRSIDVLRLYQQLNRYPARYLGGASPEYPEEALQQDISGDVTIDLLLDPGGKIRQAVVVESPGRSLSGAAFKALQGGQFESSRVGKYPVWSWLRVTIAFNLDR